MHTGGYLTLRPPLTRLASVLEGRAGDAHLVAAGCSAAGRLRLSYQYHANGVVPEERLRATSLPLPQRGQEDHGGSPRPSFGRSGVRQRWLYSREQCAGAMPGLVHAGLGWVWGGGLFRLAGDWPGVDGQPGFCALEVVVEHDG